MPWWLFVVPFLLVGLVRAVWELRRHVENGPRLARPVLLVAGLAVAAFFTVAVVQSFVALNAVPNLCDDLRAYLPMARRLLETNAIVEPWSLRGLQSLGGLTFLQAFPVAVFGNMGIAVAEYVIGGVFLAGLFVANGWRTLWAQVLSLVHPGDPRALAAACQPDRSGPRRAAPRRGIRDPRGAAGRDPCP